jgi:hypothetical protein
MTSQICSSNVTSGFIDLATFDELEKFMYGGPEATAYFVRETRKSTWFTQVPVVLSRASGTPAFQTDWSVNVSRAGDYLLQSWIRAEWNSVAVTQTPTYGANSVLRWTRNLMHNLIRECCITFNDLVAARFDNYHLDFWAAFTVPAGKITGYNNMIGSLGRNFSGVLGASAAPPAAPVQLDAMVLNLPLPLFYTRDSGVALPTAALPYNDIRIQFAFRNWTDLLIQSDNTVVNAESRRTPVVGTDIQAIPSLGQVQVWSNYAIVSNDERKKMGCAPRDILIEQVQTAPRQTFNPANNPNPQYDIRFSHAIKVLFFSARNTTFVGEWSNYITASPVPAAPGSTTGIVNFAPPGGVFDPIITTSLVYENTARLAAMGSDYYSLINPFYNAPVIPTTTGFHCYSYSLDFICLDPQGSTNYGKLTNVSIAPTASVAAVTAANGTGPAGSGMSWAQSFEFVTTTVNNNIIRVSGGALGFPVL